MSAKIPPPSTTLAAMLNELARNEGFTPSRVPGIKFMKATQNWPKQKVTYEPGIVIVAQGRKRGHLGGQTFNYDANNYLVLSVPLPFLCDTEASPEEPMLGFSVNVNPSVVAELLMDMRDLPPPSESTLLAMRSYPLDEELSDVAHRLLSTLRSQEESKILAPLLVKELTYRILRREQGSFLRALAAPHSHFGQINKALIRMREDFSAPMDVTDLAREAGMSVSTFHSHFKAITATPPLQYLKSVRLQKARLLMIEGSNAATAAREVGYESVSQFSREFKRYFNDTPMALAAKMRDTAMSYE